MGLCTKAGASGQFSPPSNSNFFVYSLTYAALPNSQWLQDACSVATSVQMGTVIWLDGLKWVKMGMKWAHFTHLGSPHCPLFFLNTFFALFGPIFGLKMAHFQVTLGP